MKKIFEKYNKIFFGLITVLLLYPTLQSGYIFFLDGHVMPNLTFSDINWQTDSIYRILYYLLAMIFSFGVFQRIYLFAIIFFLGVAGFRLAKKTGNIYARYFAGLFLIFNPFIYARLIEQAGIALGSLFFFWFLIYFLEYLEENGNNYKKIVLASVFAGLAVATFAHSVFFVAVSAAIILFFNFFKNKDWKFLLKTGAMILGVVFIINVNWILAYAIGANSRIGAVQNFGTADWKAFQTVEIGGHSVYSTVLALQGYWGEYQDRFVSIQDNPLWGVGFILIFALAIFGAFKLWKKNKFAKSLIIIFFMAYILAIGAASPIFKPIAVFFYQHIPLYIGLRESQKWVAVLVFVYAFLGSWGIKYLLEMEKIKEYRLEIGLFCVVLPVIFSFSIIKGMHEQFLPRNFPIEWTEAKKYLEENPPTGKILSFPWHSYLKLDFAGKNVVNPTPDFFGKNVIWGNNTEFGGLYSHNADQKTLAIEKYTPRDSNPAKKIDYVNFPSDMKNLGIGEIILLKAEDWQDYVWLDRISTRVLENDKLLIYELK